jgi:hypothetical protein
MDIRTGSITFARGRGPSNPRTDTTTVVFPNAVTSAFAVLTGTDFGFSGDDHHLGQVDVRVVANPVGTSVMVTATLGVRDWSGDYDDDYEGTVYFAVLSDP